MKKHSRVVMMVVLLVSLLLPTSMGLAEDELDLPIEMTGELNGAAYVIRVPENWNGTLLLYAHGYSPSQVTEPDAAILGDPAEELLLEHGYALAASGFRNAGWNVEEGIQDMQQLLVTFRQNVAHPDRVLLYGMSAGNAVVLKSMERYHGLYDGAVPICSVAMGSTRNADLKLDYTVAYAAAFEWKPSWGDIGDLPDGQEGMEVYEEVMGAFLGNLSHLSQPAYFARFEFMRLVNSMPWGGFYPPTIAPMPGPGVVLNMRLGYYLRYELEARAGGPAAQNADHVYSLTRDEKAYLAALDPTMDIDGMLATMNGMANIEASRPARQYLERFDYSGLIRDPVLMLHNIEDPLALVEGTTAYYEAVAAKGREDLLMRVYTDRPGHCNVTPEQVLAMFEAMNGWLDTGTAPSADAFPSALGFVLDYTPGPWPQPPAN